MRLAAAAVALVVLTVGVIAGVRPHGLVVVVLGAAALLELSAALGRSGARPVVAAAALPAVVLPAVAVADPAAAWARLPAFVAVAVIAAFALALAFGRRTDVTAALGATSLAGLLVGVGTLTLFLLRTVPGGLRWALALVAVTLLPEVVASVLAAVPSAPSTSAQPARLVTVGVVAGVLATTQSATFAPPTIAALAVIGVAAPAGATLLARSLAAPAAGRHRHPTQAPATRDGLLLGLLLAAPATYLLARSVEV